TSSTSSNGTDGSSSSSTTTTTASATSPSTLGSRATDPSSSSSSGKRHHSGRLPLTGLSLDSMLACGLVFLGSGFVLRRIARATSRDRVRAPLRLAGHALEVRNLVTGLRPSVLVGWGTRSAMACAAAIRVMDDRPALVYHGHDLFTGPWIARAGRAAAAGADL